MVNNIWQKIQQGVFVIAEIGKNFIRTKEDRSVEEYVANAKRLVDAACDAGADAVKFQTHIVDDEQLDIDVTSPHFQGSDRYSWVLRNTTATPFEEFWVPLRDYCAKRGILFFSTPMSRGAAQLLSKLDVPLWKIGSGDILDFVMMDYLRETAKPILFSSGMSTLAEVEAAAQFLGEKNERVALLHCVSQYPCPPEALNLNTIALFKERFAMPIGFSDHSLSVESSLGAVALGATIIEKHFSLSRDVWGSDHKVSLLPNEFKELVVGIRNLEYDAAARQRLLMRQSVRRMMGKKEKLLHNDEAAFRPLFRKSLVAACDIPVGTIIKADMLYAMRPQQYAKGLPSERYSDVLGKRAKKTIRKFGSIAGEHIVFS